MNMFLYFWMLWTIIVVMIGFWCINSDEDPNPGNWLNTEQTILSAMGVLIVFGGLAFYVLSL